MAEMIELMRYGDDVNMMQGMLQSDKVRLAREERELEQKEEKERGPNQRKRGTSRARKQTLDEESSNKARVNRASFPFNRVLAPQRDGDLVSFIC